jgi:imidazole glycerol phosphate synthase subunit HisF
MKVRASDFMQGDHIEFVLPTVAQGGQKNMQHIIELYIQTPKDIKLEATLMKGYTILK